MFFSAHLPVLNSSRPKLSADKSQSPSRVSPTTASWRTGLSGYPCDRATPGLCQHSGWGRAEGPRRRPRRGNGEGYCERRRDGRGNRNLVTRSGLYVDRTEPNTDGDVAPDNVHDNSDIIRKSTAHHISLTDSN